MTHREHTGENRAFAEMMKAAREWLIGRDPAETAKKTGINFDGTTGYFSFCCLG